MMATLMLCLRAVWAQFSMQIALEASVRYDLHIVPVNLTNWIEMSDELCGELKTLTDRVYILIPQLSHETDIVCPIRLTHLDAAPPFLSELFTSNWLYVWKRLIELIANHAHSSSKGYSGLI
jgi:hypothetical protein